MWPGSFKAAVRVSARFHERRRGSVGSKPWREDGALVIEGSMPISDVVGLLGLRDRPQGDFVTLAGSRSTSSTMCRNPLNNSRGTAGVFGSSRWTVRGSTRCLLSPLRSRTKFVKAGDRRTNAESVYPGCCGSPVIDRVIITSRSRQNSGWKDML